jgi:type I restriction enzyme, S subunit
VPKGYKQTEVGVIPEDWDVSTVGTEFSIQLGKMIDAEKNLGVLKPYLGNRAIQWGRIELNDIGLVALTPSDIQNFRLKAGDLLVCEGGEIGRAAIWNNQLPECYYQKALHRLRPIQGYDIHLMLYVLQYFADTNFLNNFVTQTSIAHLPKEKFVQVPLAVPPIEEQKLIARALSDIDALIEALEGAIGKKRHIKQGAMQELLTGKRRLPGFGEGKGYKQTEVGVIPEDWDLVLIGQLVKDFRGGAPLKPSDFVKSGVKVLPKGGVGRDTVLSVTEKDQQFCSQHYADTHFNNQVNSSYTIVVLRDLVPSGPSIGLMVEIIDSDNYVLAQGVYGFKVDIERVIPSWFIHLSNTHSYRKLMNSIMVGSTQVHVTNTAFKQAKVLLPCNIEEQQAIATILSDMDAEIATLEAKLTKTRQLKQGMMHELLTGRIRLVEEAQS